MKALFAAFFFTACAPADDPAPTGSDPVIPSSPGPAPLSHCEALDLPVAAWQESTGEARLDVAGDFTLPTTTGDWTFSENFTGCDTYLFVPSVPAQEAGWDDPLWQLDGKKLRELLPENAHVFFVSVEDDRPDVNADLEMIEDNMATGLLQIPEDEQAAFLARMHYVTDGVDDLADTWVGRLLDNPGFGFGIDRAQRIRDIGSLADADRFTLSAGWFAPNLSHVAHESIAYNWEAVRDAHLAADGAVVVPSFVAAVVEDTGWTGVRTYADLVLPDAAEMAAFDTLELDLTMGCVGPGEYGTCPAWDRIVDAYLCEVDDPENCTVEVGRWISAYHREGHWVSDASFLLPLLREGGTRRLAMYSIDPYEITLDWRFSTQGTPNPTQTDVLWRGFPAMDDNYAAAFPDQEVVIPADATRVELTVVISGHGQSSSQNCAEFCDTSHTFTVGGTSQTVSFPETSDGLYCQNDVDQGTVPNQYGTWFYGRSNWCPGKVVAPIVLDFTDAVVPGEPVTVTYNAGGPGGGPLPGSEASMDLSVFLTSRK